MSISRDQLAIWGYDMEGQRVTVARPSGQGCSDESGLHDAILGYCRARGWRVHHSRMDRPATCGVGTPDFAIAMPGGRTVWIECKTAKGKVSTEQAAWIADLRKLGHVAHVVRSFTEFLQVVEA